MMIIIIIFINELRRYRQTTKFSFHARGFHLLKSLVVVGSLSFREYVWRPIAPRGNSTIKVIEKLVVPFRGKNSCYGKSNVRCWARAVRKKVLRSFEWNSTTEKCDISLKIFKTLCPGVQSHLKFFETLRWF